MAEVNGMNGHKPAFQGNSWKVGLVNSQNKYLTAESFGFKINASGAGLKKKQSWIIEQKSDSDEVFIQSHLGRYLQADHKGNVTCDEASRDNDECKFAVEYSSSGRWAFRNVAHGNYLKGNADMVKCVDHKTSNEEKEFWSIQLAIHPQVNLKNNNRKRFARLADDALQCTEVIPWGSDSLVILEFNDGKYAIKTSDNRYLNRDGTLQDSIDADTQFTLEIHSGSFAFKDKEGCYLTAVGQNSVMKGRNKHVTKDEHFTIQDSHPQVYFVNPSNKYVSVKQGEDVSANQTEIEDNETFQIEHVPGDDPDDAGKWAIRANNGKYWTVRSDTGGIQASGRELKKEAMFSIHWQDDGRVALQAHNGKYLNNKPSGHMMLGSDVITDKEKYQMVMVNRPLLVLKTDYGFVGTKGSHVICNKTKYDIIHVQATNNGLYKLRSGNFWCVNDDASITTDGGAPAEFVFEFTGQSTLVIRTSGGKYLKGEQNGIFTATVDEKADATQWEF